MAVTGNQQVKHPGGCRPIIDKLLFCQLLWIDDPDGGGQPLVPVNHAVPHHRDPYLIGQMPDHNGLRAVKDHAGFMQHPPDHVHGVLRRVKMLLAWQDIAVGIGDFYILPLVDVDLLHIIAGKVTA